MDGGCMFVEEGLERVIIASHQRHPLTLAIFSVSVPVLHCLYWVENSILSVGMLNIMCISILTRQTAMFEAYRRFRIGQPPALTFMIEMSQSCGTEKRYGCNVMSGNHDERL